MIYTQETVKGPFRKYLKMDVREGAMKSVKTVKKYVGGEGMDLCVT